MAKDNKGKAKAKGETKEKTVKVSRKDVTAKAMEAVKKLKTLGDYTISKFTTDKKGRLIGDIGNGLGLKIRVRAVKLAK